MNSERHNFEGLRIYGLLTDLNGFHFYSYDPTEKKFYLDEKMYVDASRLPFLSGMIAGTYFTWRNSLKAHAFCHQCRIKSLALY